MRLLRGLTPIPATTRGDRLARKGVGSLAWVSPCFHTRPRLPINTSTSSRYGQQFCMRRRLKTTSASSDPGPGFELSPAKSTGGLGSMPHSIHAAVEVLTLVGSTAMCNVRALKVPDEYERDARKPCTPRSEPKSWNNVSICVEEKATVQHYCSSSVDVICHIARKWQFHCEAKKCAPRKSSTLQVGTYAVAVAALCSPMRVPVRY